MLSGVSKRHPDMSSVAVKIENKIWDCRSADGLFDSDSEEKRSEDSGNPSSSSTSPPPTFSHVIASA